MGAFGLNAGYAAVASIQRVVGNEDGQIRPANLLQEGASADKAGNDLPAVNEGAYRGFTHILSLGISISFDELLGSRRKIHIHP